MLCCSCVFVNVCMYLHKRVYTQEHKQASILPSPPYTHTHLHTRCSVLYHSLKICSRLLYEINKNKEKMKYSVQEMRTSSVTSNAQQTMKISCSEEMAEHHLHHFDTSSIINIFLHFLLFAENVSYW